MRARAADIAVAAATLAMLAMLSLPAASSLVSQDKEAACVQTLGSIWKQLDAYRSRHGSFPADSELILDPFGLWNPFGEPEPWQICPVGGNPYRTPSGNLNERKSEAVADPIFADPLVGVRRTSHGDARTVGANVLYRDGSVRRVTRKEAAVWAAMLAGTSQHAALPDVAAGDVWTYRTTEDPDLRVTLAVEAVVLEGSVQLAALVYKDSKGRERWRDVVYPTPQGWRFFKRAVDGRTLPVKPAGERARRVADLIDELNSDDPFERMGAAEKIADIWFDARDAVEEAIARTAEPEVGLKLRQALATGIRSSGPMLLQGPLTVGASWETPAGGGQTLRHEVQDELFIVTALGETHCFKVRTDSPDRTVTTWLGPSHGPVVIQIVSKSDGSKIEWRVESFKGGPRRIVWMCPFCGDASVVGEDSRGRPTCEFCGIPLQPIPSDPRGLIPKRRHPVPRDR
jgi:hypothetical protein